MENNMCEECGIRYKAVLFKGRHLCTPCKNRLIKEEEEKQTTLKF